MGRQRLLPVDTRGIQRRLGQYVDAHDGWPAFERVTGLPHATVDGWRRGTSVPELPTLLLLARQDPGLSLDWLLVGRAAGSRVAEPGPGWVREEHVQRLIQNLARGALERMKEERSKLLQQMKRAPKKPRRLGGPQRSTHKRKGGNQ